jgi:2-polyprenyl-3-methyl-5-hydroxy-6-metoxy-1,4-benzoquinol methylase
MGLLESLADAPTERVDNCVLCEAPGVNDPRWAWLLALPEPYGVKRCPTCSLRWLSPRPGAVGLSILYSAEHYFHGGEGTGYSTFVAERSEHFRGRLREVAGLAGPNARVLDYGAATGEFVAIAAEMGMDPVGVEFSEAARREAQAKGVTLLAPDETVNGPFDVIHMNHVLEHMPDPLAHLRWCRSMLSPGGLVVAEVPAQFDNDLDRIKRALGKWTPEFNAFSLHHTYFFTSRTMSALFKRAGFQARRVRTFVPTQRPTTSWKRRILRWLLWLSDKTHRGGDVIEIYAER